MPVDPVTVAAALVPNAALWWQAKLSEAFLFEKIIAKTVDALRQDLRTPAWRDRFFGHSSPAQLERLIDDVIANRRDFGDQFLIRAWESIAGYEQGAQSTRGVFEASNKSLILFAPSLGCNPDPLCKRQFDYMTADMAEATACVEAIEKAAWDYLRGSNEAAELVESQVAQRRPAQYERDAYLSYVEAIKTQPSLERRTLRDVHEWIRHHGVEIDGSPYRPPDFDTWARYRRTGESAARPRGNS